jgi:hypothetical protein
VQAQTYQRPLREKHQKLVVEHRELMSCLQSLVEEVCFFIRTRQQDVLEFGCYEKCAHQFSPSEDRRWAKGTTAGVK